MAYIVGTFNFSGRNTPLTIKVTDTHKSYYQKNGHVSL